MKAVRVDSVCPMCRSSGSLTLLTNQVNIPYFGDSLETTLRCEACGFRHADFMIMGQKEPTRLTLHAKTEEALSVRVIRSNSGTIRIPEIGFMAEPTPYSESFVSNVEGVLQRALDVLKMATEFWKDDPAKAELLTQYLETYAKLVAGTQPFTLIIDDPFGNSAIVSEEVERRLLTEEEVAALKTGTIMIDASELAAAEEGSGST